VFVISEIKDRLFSKACSDRTRRSSFKLKEGTFRLDIRDKFFTGRLAQAAQRGGRCPIPANVPGQAGRGSEHPDPAGAAHGRGAALDDLYMSLPTQTVPRFHAAGC